MALPWAGTGCPGPQTREEGGVELDKPSLHCGLKDAVDSGTVPS